MSRSIKSEESGCASTNESSTSIDTNESPSLLLDSKKQSRSNLTTSSSLRSREKKDFIELAVDWCRQVFKTIWEMWLTTYRMVMLLKFADTKGTLFGKLCLMYTYPNATRHATWIAYKAIMISYKYDLWSLIGVYALMDKEKKPKTSVIKSPESGWLARIGFLFPKSGSDSMIPVWAADGIMHYLKSGTEKKSTETAASASTEKVSTNSRLVSD